MKDETIKTDGSTVMDPPETEKKPELDPNWAHDALQELEDWIESQGIYIRQ